MAFQCGAFSTRFFQWCCSVPCKYSLGRPVLSQCTLGQPVAFQCTLDQPVYTGSGWGMFVFSNEVMVSQQMSLSNRQISTNALPFLYSIFVWLLYYEIKIYLTLNQLYLLVPFFFSKRIKSILVKRRINVWFLSIQIYFLSRRPALFAAWNNNITFLSDWFPSNAPQLCILYGPIYSSNLKKLHDSVQWFWRHCQNKSAYMLLHVVKSHFKV